MIEEESGSYCSDLKKPLKNCCQRGTCHRDIARSFLDNFIKGCGFKLLAKLFAERSVSKVMQTYKEIPKFGLVLGLFSALFKITRCFFNKYFPDIDARVKNFMSGMVCSLALLFAS